MRRIRPALPLSDTLQSHGPGPRTASLILAVLVLPACGAGPPEERLSEAHEALVAQRLDVQEVERTVEEKRAAVERAEEALAKARAELARAESELAQARERIDERATDVALFRAVQGALLRQDALETFAIRAEVEGGVVTLRGEVDEPDQAERALAVARSMPGVEELRSEIRVREADARKG